MKHNFCFHDQHEQEYRGQFLSTDGATSSIFEQTMFNYVMEGSDAIKSLSLRLVVSEGTQTCTILYNLLTAAGVRGL